MRLSIPKFDVAHFFLCRILSVISKKKLPGRTSNCVAGFAKQVVLFAVQKVTCRPLRGGAATPLFRFAKGSQGDIVYIMTMNKRTKRIEIRLTEAEYAHITSKAESYNSIGQYIRCAIKEYSNVDARQKLRLIENLGNFYRESRSELSHIGGNLNQSVKRANELAISGLLNSTYISQILMPEIVKTRKVMDSLQRQLLSLTKKATTI